MITSEEFRKMTEEYPNSDVMTIEGGQPHHRWTIPRLLPGIPIHVVIDQPNAKPKLGVINAFISIEPPGVDPGIHSLLRNAAWCSQWDIIACANTCTVALQDRVRKYVETPFWVEPPKLLSTPKHFGISTIISHKRYAEGHRLRYWFMENWPSTVPSKIFTGSNPSNPEDLVQPYPADRRDCFTYMFHLVIENSRSPCYFTEKLMDCLRCRCVPLYWGAPDIGETFDTSGMILIGDLNPYVVLELMKRLTVEDYTKRLEAVLKNAEIVEQLCEGPNPYPLDPNAPRSMHNRLGALLREAQQQKKK